MLLSRSSNLVAVLVVGALSLSTRPAAASPDIARSFPLERDCATCHATSAGGLAPGCAGPDWCLNPFGLEVQRRVHAGDPLWDAALGALDSDMDGYSNAAELGDLDGDGVRDDADWPVRSPGIPENVDLDECALGIAECGDYERCLDVRATHIADRPSFACPCVPEARGRDASGACIPPCDPGFEEVDGVCVPACAEGFVRRDGRCMRRYHYPDVQVLPDNVWVEVRPEDGHPSIYETSCDPDGVMGGRAVLFAYPADCPGGEVWVESDAGAHLAVVSTRHGRDIDCTRSGALRLPPDRELRVIGSGSVRAVCHPGLSGGSLRSETAPTCSTARRVGEGAHPLYFHEYDWRGDTVPGDTCSMDLQADLWLAHRATCDGRLRVDLGNTDWCFRHEEFVAVYPDGQCPERDGPLACTAYTNDFAPTWGPPRECTEDADGGGAVLSVRRGEEVLLRIAGSASSALSYSDEVRIECEPGPRCDAAFCDPAATCTEGEDTLGVRTAACACPEGFEGDGIPVGRGGSGCVLLEDPECDLDCDENARCYLRWETEAEWRARLAADPDSDPGFLRRPYCGCDDGYFGSGFSCRREEPCDGVRCGHHTVCIDEWPAHRCDCAPGYQPDVASDELRCVPVCGDGEVAPGEVCDDGNTRNGDGCSSHCEVEPTFRCLQSNPPASYCISTCDDGFVDDDDPLCDDGDDDGCNCRTGRDSSRPGAFALLLAAWVLVRRRRRE